MLPYQNYYPVYQNNFQQQIPNPYMQRMENLQQFQQAIQQPIAPTQNQQFSPLGKMVESIDIVRVTDIPMDGNVYYFPKADGTEIYSKQFMPNGQTRILSFKPIIESEPNNVASEVEKSNLDGIERFLVGIQEDIKALNEKIDKLDRPIKQIKTKKEEAESE